jgi:hypothetical protein
MNDLERFFTEHRGRQLTKWRHYLEIYDAHFARFRGTDVHVMEIGINHGGSLQMWRQYFGERATIYGVDINPHCRAFEEPGTRVFIGDQSDTAFLESLARSVPRIDILIDDGGHTMAQQVETCRILLPRVSERGVYLCEDTCTSYWRKYGGGLRRSGTFIEHAKGLVDRLHAWHSEDPARLAVDDFTRSVRSIAFYDGVVVFEKRPVVAPDTITAGSETVADFHVPPSGWRGVRQRLEHRLKRLLGRH